MSDDTRKPFDKIKSQMMGSEIGGEIRSVTHDLKKVSANSTIQRFPLTLDELRELFEAGGERMLYEEEYSHIDESEAPPDFDTYIRRKIEKKL